MQSKRSKKYQKIRNRILKKNNVVSLSWSYPDPNWPAQNSDMGDMHRKKTNQSFCENCQANERRSSFQLMCKLSPIDVFDRHWYSCTCDVCVLHGDVLNAVNSVPFRYRTNKSDLDISQTQTQNTQTIAKEHNRFQWMSALHMCCFFGNKPPSGTAMSCMRLWKRCNAMLACFQY